VSFGQVIPPGEPLPNLSENQLVWASYVRIRKVEKNGTVDYTVEFAHPARNTFDELVRKCMTEAVVKLPR
jgi:hypothetical protein